MFKNNKKNCYRKGLTTKQLSKINFTKRKSIFRRKTKKHQMFDILLKSGGFIINPKNERVKKENIHREASHVACPFENKTARKEN